jgi:uncharacterized protein YjiS (DUF1127 family)
MAAPAFLADTSIPGLGASDLTRRVGGHVETDRDDGRAGSFARLRAALAADHRQHQMDRDLAGLDARVLCDIGLDRSRQ